MHIADALVLEERAAIVAWLRDIENQHLVINLTFAMRNPDVINAMNKCAEIIEKGAAE